MAITLSCAFATSSQSHEHAAIAEHLGYTRAWFYDSPALYPDVWVQLCRAAERTTRIGLGPGVLVPNLRHPMTNAAAIATLVEIAGQDRVVIGVGSGFTARVTLGQRPLTWKHVREYLKTLRGLLRGQRVEWDGKMIQMMHPDGFGARRPIDVPFVIAAAGPKGVAAAKALAEGIFTTSTHPIHDEEITWNAVLTFGTVLDDGEDPGSARAIEAAGHGAAVALHVAVEFDNFDALPRGAEWASVYQDLPVAERHIALHDRHLVGVNDRDKPFVTGEVMTAFGLALDKGAWREKLAGIEEQGGTEIVYQPAGGDIARELESFAALLV